jgi:tetratricopeptide (TPR) repeat protein
MKGITKLKAVFFLLVLFILSFSCASQGAAQAEEYFSIGMAYFEMGKFSEAEMWLNRARAADKTMIASEYNLGRIAFETGRYEEACRYFETLLKSDPDNIMALKAAAYSRIKNGDIEIAEGLYKKVLELLPEDLDDGFNYALVLYGLEKYDDSIAVLNKYPFALEEKAPSILLLARAQRALEQVEAIDTYAKWVIVNAGASNAQGFFEYGQVLEKAGHYARALEQYDSAIGMITKNTETHKRAFIRFEKSRLLLTVDPSNEDGLKEFTKSIDEGFNDKEAIADLLSDDRVVKSNKDEIQKALDKLEEESKDKVPDDEEDEDDDSGDNT